MEKFIYEAKAKRIKDMKHLFLVSLQFILLCGYGITTDVQAQTVINKSIPYSTGQDVVMHFDYPEHVQVVTWDKNEIQITGKVSINHGENDDAFLLENKVSGKIISIRSEIKNMDKLPHRVTAYRGGQKFMFKSKKELQAYQDEHGYDFKQISMGPDIDITLEIKVPAHVKTKVESVYGFVEVKHFDGPLTVEATYGGVDATVKDKVVGEVVAETNYGNIYTDLPVKFNGKNSNEDFHTLVSAKFGGRAPYRLLSPYGNVYLRKSDANR